MGDTLETLEPLDSLLSQSESESESDTMSIASDQDPSSPCWVQPSLWLLNLDSLEPPPQSIPLPSFMSGVLHGPTDSPTLRMESQTAIRRNRSSQAHMFAALPFVPAGYSQSHLQGLEHAAGLLLAQDRVADRAAAPHRRKC